MFLKIKKNVLDAVSHPIKPFIVSFFPYYFVFRGHEPVLFFLSLPLILSYLLHHTYGKTGKVIRLFSVLYEAGIFILPYFMFLSHTSRPSFLLLCLPLVASYTAKQCFNKESALVNVLAFLYVAGLLVMIFFSVYVPLFLTPLTFVALALVFIPLLMTKWLTAPFVCALLIGAGIYQVSQQYDVSHYDAAGAEKKLRKETYASLVAPMKKFAKKGFSVRNIYFYGQEDALYFTTTSAFLGSEDKIQPVLFKLSLKKQSLESLYYFYITNICHDPQKKVFYAFAPYQKKLLTIKESPLTIREKRAVALPYIFLDCYRDEKNRGLLLLPEDGPVGFLPDAKKFAVLKQSTLHSFGGAFVEDKEAEKLYPVTYGIPFYLYEWDLNTREILRGKRLGFWGGAWSIAYDAEKDVFYIPAFFTGKIYVVGKKDFAVQKVFSLKPGLRPVCFDAKRKLVYAANLFEEELYVLNTDGGILKTFFVGKGTRSIVLSPKSNRLFVGNALGIVEVSVDRWLADTGREKP